MSAAGYEEQRGRARRIAERFARPIAWRVKGWLGMRRTIVVEMRWRLGDEIMALPIYDGLREIFPHDRIVVWTNYPELLAANDSIDTLNQRVRFADRFILLRGADHRAYRLDDYAKRGGLAKRPGRPAIQIDRWPRAILDELPSGPGPLVVIAPGASWTSKRWPTERWREFGEVMESRGARVVELCQADESVGVAHSFAGQTSLREAAVILAHADLLVAHDSGLMHLALAVGTPVVALFGPTAPECVVQDEPLLVAIENRRPCAACWNRSQEMVSPGVCPRGIADCMATISVDEVVAIVERLGIGNWKQCASFF